MMKLILSLTLVWALASSAAAQALNCLTCTNLTCSATSSVQCTTETMCATAAISADIGGTTVQQITRGCAAPSLCPATGSQTFSVNLSGQSIVASVECCSTDDCNSQPLSFPSVGANNSLTCLTCDPFTSQCNIPLQCTGAQDQCIQGNLTVGSATTPVFGCVSSNICAGAASVEIPILGNVTLSSPTCCNTTQCNNATTSDPTGDATGDAHSVRLSMIHLLLGLFFFTLY